jgi:hypothetical protein
MKPDLVPVPVDLWVLYENAPGAPWLAVNPSDRPSWQSRLRRFFSWGREAVPSVLGVYGSIEAAMQHLAWLRSIPESGWTERDGCWVVAPSSGSYFTIETLFAYYPLGQIDGFSVSRKVLLVDQLN